MNGGETSRTGLAAPQDSLAGAYTARPMNAPAYSLGQRLASEFIGAAFLLTAIVMTVIFLTVRRGGFGLAYTAPAVGLFIGAGRFFTSSGAFANPAVTIARMFSDTYSGIAPASVPVFLGGQVVGTGSALLAPGGGEAAH